MSVITANKIQDFTSVSDVESPDSLIQEVIRLKKDPFQLSGLGKNKTIGLMFMNPSLRTRLSTQKAAQNLGMNVMMMNVSQESWQIEFSDGAVMNLDKQEHVKDAAAVIGNYCDIVGLRCFPGLSDRDADYSEFIFKQFRKYCAKPLISLESATVHPLQSLADLTTIEEHRPAGRKAKVVLSWAPHVRPLPQAVANSFSEWMLTSGHEFVIARPDGYELSENFTAGAKQTSNQDEALEGADFVYVKNWSSFRDYGAMPAVPENWLLDTEKMKATNDAYIMHCLPVRRNVELTDALLDSPRSLVLKQAENRVYAAQAVLANMLGQIRV